jgi:predicted thioesterase
MHCSRNADPLHVEPRHLASSFKDSILAPVFSTPYLVLIMENAALNAIKQYLEAGESAVGTRVAPFAALASERPQPRGCR